jgi:phenylacetic acid degradation operon negative regulatory protein
LLKRNKCVISTFVPSGRRITPKSLVLDLLSAARPGAVPVSGLLGVAELFGLGGNALRVALTRLVARGLVESDERGSYRLGPAGDPLSEHVDEWRRGERRLRRWDGAWLSVVLERGAERGARARSVRALELLGFRDGLGALWVRPDNLAGGVEAVHGKLARLGLEPGAEAFVLSHPSASLGERWTKHLWPLRKLESIYSAALGEIERSERRLPDLDTAQAAVETFRVGGNAIRVLATDPLLPDEMLPGETRRKLSEAMLRYDQVGRRAWAKLARRATSPRLVALEGGAA